MEEHQKQFCSLAAEMLNLAANTVKTVRCKDCVNRSKEKYNHLGELKYFCAKVEKYVPDDGFCYMGGKGNLNGEIH